MTTLVISKGNGEHHQAVVDTLAMFFVHANAHDAGDCPLNCLVCTAQEHHNDPDMLLARQRGISLNKARELLGLEPL